MTRLSIVIPAYQPGEELIQLVNTLAKQAEAIPLILVNDGSGQEFNDTFNKLSHPRITVLTHESNLGKGAALKTAFKHWLEHLSGQQAGLITTDADGQHAVDDIIQIAEALNNAPEKLHLGIRTFEDKDIPWRSRFGNNFTRGFFRILSKTSVSDTQTGLRGIPKTMINQMIESKHDGYEFETEMLLNAVENKLDIMQHPIKTIYINNNLSSHFKPVIDSLKIYWVLIRFCFISITSAILDVLIFSIFYMYSQDIFFSLLIARITSSIYNFASNKRFVFRSDQPLSNSAVKYLALVVVNFLMAYLLLRTLNAFYMNIYIAKIISDIILFALSFTIQNWLIFGKKDSISN